VYFRVEGLETVEVYCTHFGAETTFLKHKDIVSLDEYLTHLIFNNEYTVIGGLWRNSVYATLNIQEREVF